MQAKNITAGSILGLKIMGNVSYYEAMPYLVNKILTRGSPQGSIPCCSLDTA